MEKQLEDNDIKVKLTGADNPYCVRIEMPDVTINLHVLSAIDLHRKLGLALSDWISITAKHLINQLFARM